jgi:hypothetical protein
MKRIPLFIVALLLYACQLSPEKRVDQNQAKFSTTADSRLFFKNVRQIYYDREIPENTKLEVYRFGKRSLTPDKPVINVALVNNWLHDEAYVIVEPNGYFDNMSSIEVEWQDDVSRQSGVYRFTYGPKDTHFKFASEIYQSVLAKHKLQVLNPDKQWVDLFQTDVDRDNFRKTMKDFYRLVNLM